MQWHGWHAINVAWIPRCFLPRKSLHIEFSRIRTSLDDFRLLRRHLSEKAHAVSHRRSGWTVAVGWQFRCKTVDWTPRSGENQTLIRGNSVDANLGFGKASPCGTDCNPVEREWHRNKTLVKAEASHSSSSSWSMRSWHVEHGGSGGAWNLWRKGCWTTIDEMYDKSYHAYGVDVGPWAYSSCWSRNSRYWGGMSSGSGFWKWQWRFLGCGLRCLDFSCFGLVLRWLDILHGAECPQTYAIAGIRLVTRMGISPPRRSASVTWLESLNACRFRWSRTTRCFLTELKQPATKFPWRMIMHQACTTAWWNMVDFWEMDVGWAKLNGFTSQHWKGPIWSLRELLDQLNTCGW